MNVIARRLLTLAVRQNSSPRPPIRTRLRLGIETLEDRNAPGSLLGELLAAAYGGQVPNPLDPYARPLPLHETALAAPRLSPSAVPSDSPPFATVPIDTIPDGSEPSSSRGTPELSPSPTVSVSLSLDDEDVLFARPVPQGLFPNADTATETPAPTATVTGGGPTAASGPESVGSNPAPQATPATTLIPSEPAGRGDRASIRSAVGDATIEITARGKRLDNVFSAKAPATQDPNVVLPYGLIGFQVEGVTPGGLVTVDMTWPGDAKVDGYYKQDPHTLALNRFDFDGQTGAVVRGNTISLSLRDGGRGDDDGVVNGVVVDPGGPGYGSYEVVMSALVNEVTFSGADLITIEADPGTPTYPNPPHWLDTNGNGAIDVPGDRALPVGYPRNTNSVVSAKFTANISTWPYPPSNYNLMVRAYNTLSAWQPYDYTIPPTSVSLQGGSLYLPPTTITDPFPGTVNYGTLTIDWQFSNNGGTSWTSAGRTENELYVTLDTPAATSPVYHTLLFLSIPAAGAVAAATEAVVISETFSKFATGKVTNKHINPAYNGKKLHYYKEWTTTVWNSITLLSGKDGNCFAWSYLFADSLRAAGVKHTLMQRATVQSKTLLGVPGDQQRESLLVNNWYFNPDMPGSGDATYPFQNMSKYPDSPSIFYETNAAEQWQSVWGPNEGAQDLPGAGGQNVTDPLSLFVNHCMMKINGVYYDPSYGEQYTSLQDWEDTAVAGFMLLDAPGKRFVSRQNPTGAGVPADTEEDLVTYAGVPLPPPP